MKCFTAKATHLGLTINGLLNQNIINNQIGAQVGFEPSILPVQTLREHPDDCPARDNTCQHTFWRLDFLP